MKTRTGAALAVLCLGAAGALAETETNTTILVTATRVETEASRTGVTTETIPADALVRSRAPAAPELLRPLPGVEAVRTGGPGTASSVFLRGANRSHTLVLVDGVRVNDNASGGFNFEDLPPGEYERVEIVKGAQSALYGSDAIGGVINFIPRRGVIGDRPRVTLSAEAGNYDHLRANATVEGGATAGDYRLSAGHWELGGYDVSTAGGPKTPDGYERRHAGGHGGLNLGADGRLDVTALYADGRADLDGFNADDTDRHQLNESLFTGARYRDFWASSVRQTLQTGYSRMESEGRDNGTREFRFNTQSLSALTQTDWFADEETTVSAGYQFEARSARNDGNYRRENQYVHAGFAEVSRRVGSATVNAGGRYDRITDFGGEATWRGAASVPVAEFTRLHASAGTGFKAPSLNDLYWPASEWSAGNPDLDAERSLNWDAGVEQGLFEREVVLDATVFASRIDDLINWASADGVLWKPENVDQATIEGVEVSATWKPVEVFQSRVFYTRTEARDDRTDAWLARRARDRAGAQASVRFLGRGTAQVEYIYTGRRHDDAANEVRLDAYSLVNLSASWAVGNQWTVYGRVENVLDEEYEEAAGFGTLGSYGFLGVQCVY